MFSTNDVSDYYDQTEDHYEVWWKLSKGLSLHYGMWLPGTRTFLDALANTNRVLMEAAAIQAEDHVLDAGCGVGGAAFFLAETQGCRVTGITLNERQVSFAKEKATEKGLSDQVDFVKGDYTNTGFPDQSFNVVWACESMSSAVDKAAFVEEAFRILKPGGRLVISDYFLTDDSADQHPLLAKWLSTWSIARIMSVDAFSSVLQEVGFESPTVKDCTVEITPSARRMYRSYWVGALPSMTYNLLFGARRFARHHYRSGKYQYLALRRGLWHYPVITAQKPNLR